TALLLAASGHAAPLALLLSQVELAAGDRLLLCMRLRVMREISLIRIVRRQRPHQLPQLAQLLTHVRTSASATAGASELGGTGKPFTTRQLTRSMSAITIHRIATSIIASAASSR